MQNNNKHLFIEKLPSLKHTVKFSDAEKQVMRSTLASYADLHDVIAPPAAARMRVSSFSFFYSRAFIASALIFILVIGSGVGVTYAAGNALPGQPLYAVKVDVAEPIQTALITSPVAQADWQNTLAERRLDEATTLAAENDLSSSTQQYLEQQASIHINQSEQDSDAIAASGQTGVALAIRSDLEARLSAHSQVLALLDSRLQADGDATTTHEVALLLEKVSQANSSVSLSREASEVALEPVSMAVAMALSSEVSTTTPPQRRVTLALVTEQDSKRHTEETQLFVHEASMLGLLPLKQAATTTATTTIEATTTSETASSSAPTIPGL